MLCFILVSASQAQQILVLEETYDNLPLGRRIPGWIAVEPENDQTLPVIQNVSFKSAPHGMKIDNDFYVLRPFNPIEGIVTVELWWNPKVGADTNSFLRIELEGHGGVTLVGKNETDWWRYSTRGVQKPFRPVDGKGHDVKVVYKTSTGTYDLFFDSGLINSNIPLESGIVENKRIIGISLSSGRGGVRTTSYFDDLKVYTTKSATDKLPTVSFTAITATSPIIADGISASTITITIKDSTSKPIPNKTISISVTGSNNSIRQTSPLTDQNGMTTTILKSTKAETKTVSITVDGTPMDDTAKIEFLPDVVSTANSTIITSGSAIADGTSQIKLTITLLDANKNPIKDKKVIVSATGIGNIVVQPEKPTDKNGVTTAFISSNKAEDKTINATVAVDEIKLKLIVVTFNPLPQPKIVVRATSPHIADGEDTSTIILNLTDANDNPLPNKSSTISSVSGTGNILVPPAFPTDATGRTTAKLKSTNPETKTITATYELNGQKIQATTTVEFQASSKPVPPLSLKKSFIRMDIEPTQPRLGDKLKISGWVISQEGEIGLKLPIMISYKPPDRNRDNPELANR